MTNTDISPATIRAHFAAIDLPGGIVNMGPGEYVETLDVFIDTQLARLESEAPLLRRLALKNLVIIAEKIGHPLPVE